MAGFSFVCWVDTPSLGATSLFNVCCSQQTLKIPHRLRWLGFLFYQKYEQVCHEVEYNRIGYISFFSSVKEAGDHCKRVKQHVIDHNVQHSSKSRRRQCPVMRKYCAYAD